MMNENGTTSLLRDGDAGFLGVNQAVPPGELGPGELPDAKNARFTSGDAEPRLGVAKLPWTNLITTDSDTPLPFGSIHGATTFRDPDDIEWVIIAANGTCYATLEGGNATEIRLPPGVTIDADVTFMQAFNGLIMFRGPDLPVLKLWDVDDGWELVAQEVTPAGVALENPVPGTDDIPQATSGEWVGNRAFIPYEDDTDGKDLIAISDYMNATLYAPIRSSGRINQGSSDALVRYFKFSDTKGICFKEGSIYGLYNTQFDLSEMYLDAITTELGTRSPRGVVHVGKDGMESAPSSVWFMAERRGVMAIAEGDQGKLQVGAVPVSREIQRLIERIDWRNQGLIRAEQWNNKVYFAVPLDESKNYGPELIEHQGAGTSQAHVVPGQVYRWIKGATAGATLVNHTATYADGQEFTAAAMVLTVNGNTSQTGSLVRVYEATNNAILVYDLIRQKWAGYDTGTAMMVKEFFKTTYIGPRRLFFVSTDGFINLMEEQFFDDAACEAPEEVNLASGSYDAGGMKSFTVLPGRRYLLTAGAGDTGYVNGTETVVMASGDSASFIAQGTGLTLNGTPSAAVAAVLYLSTWVLEVEWVDYDVTFRGLRCGVNGRKRFIQGRLELATWYPRFSVGAVTDGANEEAAIISDRTKSRTAYYAPFNKPAWNETNAADDHATPLRQDYSIVLGDTPTASGAIAAGLVYLVESSGADVDAACSITYNGVVRAQLTTFTGVAGVTTFSVTSGTPLVYGPGNYVLFGENGIDPDLHQETWEPFRLGNVPGREVRLRVRCNQGRCIVKALEVEAVSMEGRLRVAA